MQFFSRFDTAIWRCHRSGRSPPWSIPCRNGGRAGFDLVHPAPQWLSTDFQDGGSNRCIFHGTLDTIPAGQRRFKRIFTQMPCVLLFLCLSPVLILFQEIRDLLWYRFMRPGAISNTEVWLTQCADEDIRGLRDIQNTQKSTAFLSIKQKNILYLAKNA